ncbi:hypothetical protein LINPERPRIM_LOCUS41150 [Linum perenne]
MSQLPSFVCSSPPSRGPCRWSEPSQPLGLSVDQPSSSRRQFPQSSPSKSSPSAAVSFVGT